MRKFFDRFRRDRNNSEADTGQNNKQDDKNTNSAKVVMHYLANGNYETVRGADLDVHKGTTDFFEIVDSRFENFVVYEGSHYVLNDYLAESYEDNMGAPQIVLHIRYILDVEKSDFLDFLESATPADVAS